MAVQSQCPADVAADVGLGQSRQGDDERKKKSKPESLFIIRGKVGHEGTSASIMLGLSEKTG
jgi:hypothetical protein